MRCSYCGGLVTWRGPLVALTHTQCERCGAVNSQEAEDEDLAELPVEGSGGGTEAS